MDKINTTPNVAALATIRADLLDAEQRGRTNWLHVGEVGEDIVAALHPDWTRASRGAAGHDFVTPAGVRVQVKTCGGKLRGYHNIKPGADHLIVILLVEGGGFKVICDCAITAADWKAMERPGKDYLVWTRALDRVAS